MEEAKGDVHRAHDLGKLMNPAVMFLVWEGGLHVDLAEGFSGSGADVPAPHTDVG